MRHAAQPGWLSALGLALCLAAPAARAALPDEIQVYTDDVEAPRERGVELHVNTTPQGRATPAHPGEVVTHHGLRITPELSYGIAPGWDAGIYLPFVRSAAGADFLGGVKFRLKRLPLRPAEGASGAFAGVNGEIAFVQQRLEEARRSAELRPILGYRGDAWLASFNPIIGTDLAGEEKGVLVLAPAFKLARQVSSRAEQSHTLYVVLDTERLDFGIGRGFAGAADRSTVKAIVSF